MTSQEFVERVWYGDSALRFALLPLSWIYSLLAWTRAGLYRLGLLQTRSPAAPVVVVGNITAGGTGKTPIVIWLANALAARDLRVAVVARGYGGSSRGATVRVTPESDTNVVGDEPVLIARRTEAAVYINANRYAAAAFAVEDGADVVISDDGLQHLGLGRQVEIAVVDTERGFGNGLRVPAGPLREPVSRLASVDRVLLHGSNKLHLASSSDVNYLSYSLHGSSVRRIADGEQKPIECFAGKSVHAVAGIGNPERFFTMLEDFGINIHRHPFPDHAKLSSAELTFADDLPVLMTEKDGVKCPSDSGQHWTIPVDVVFSGEDERLLIQYVLEKSGLGGGIDE